jgi:hypothetical protein
MTRNVKIISSILGKAEAGDLVAPSVYDENAPSAKDSIAALELANDTTAFDQHLIVHPSFQCNLPPSDLALPIADFAAAAAAADQCIQPDACMPPSPSNSMGTLQTLELSNDTAAIDGHLIVHPSFQCNLPPSDFAVADVCSDATLFLHYAKNY